MIKQNIAKEEQQLFLEDSDENFYFIAGYTSSGFPYGVAWDEIEDAPDFEK